MELMDAYKLLKSKRSQAKPKSNFLTQLVLYAKKLSGGSLAAAKPEAKAAGAGSNAASSTAGEAVGAESKAETKADAGASRKRKAEGPACGPEHVGATGLSPKSPHTSASPTLLVNLQRLLSRRRELLGRRDLHQRVPRDCVQQQLCTFSQQES
jgi:hypothetical protein